MREKISVGEIKPDHILGDMNPSIVDDLDELLIRFCAIRNTKYIINLNYPVIHVSIRSAITKQEVTQFFSIFTHKYNLDFEFRNNHSFKFIRKVSTYES